MAVVAGVVIGTGGDDRSAPSGATSPGPGAPAATGSRPRPAPMPVVRLRGGRPVGGVRTLEFRASQRVRFAVSSDVEQEIHVHGYEVERTVPAGGRVVFSLAAGPQGVFEIESHTTGEPVASLKVAP